MNLIPLENILIRFLGNRSGKFKTKCEIPFIFDEYEYNHCTQKVICLSNVTSKIVKHCRLGQFLFRKALADDFGLGLTIDPTFKLANITLEAGMHRLEFMIIMLCLGDDCSSKNDQTLVTLTGTNDLALFKRSKFTYENVDRNFIGWQKRFIEFKTTKKGDIEVRFNQIIKLLRFF